jgi:enoyl-CoA hydratase/carnithine racemase
MNQMMRRQQAMKDHAATKTAQICLTRRSPEYWRVTFDHPPLNIFGPQMLPQLDEIITAIETDEQVKVVVFDSAVEGFFLIHLDFLANLNDLAHLPPGPTGLQSMERDVGSPESFTCRIDSVDPRADDWYGK